jgi:hypothetical protein
MLVVILGLYVLSSGALASAETIGSSEESPLLRALHPEASRDTQIITFHFGDETYKVPRNYLVSGSDIPKSNEPGYFTIIVLLPDLTPRTDENAGEFKKLGVGRLLRASVHHDMHLQATKIVINRFLSLGGVDRTEFFQTPNKLKLFRASIWDIYVSDYRSHTDLFFTTCDLDSQPSPWKSCHVMEQITKDDVLEYYFNKNYINDAINIDADVRKLISTFSRKESDLPKTMSGDSQ